MAPTFDETFPELTEDDLLIQKLATGRIEFLNQGDVESLSLIAQINKEILWLWGVRVNKRLDSLQRILPAEHRSISSWVWGVQGVIDSFRLAESTPMLASRQGSTMYTLRSSTRHFIWESDLPATDARILLILDSYEDLNRMWFHDWKTRDTTR